MARKEIQPLEVKSLKEIQAELERLDDQENVPIELVRGMIQLLIRVAVYFRQSDDLEKILEASEKGNCSRHVTIEQAELMSFTLLTYADEHRHSAWEQIRTTWYYLDGEIESRCATSEEVLPIVKHLLTIAGESTVTV